MNRIPIKISEIIELKERLSEINRLNLSDIDFIDYDNTLIKIEPSIIEDFKFTGLNNTDFIWSGFYKDYSVD